MTCWWQDLRRVKFVSSGKARSLTPYSIPSTPHIIQNSDKEIWNMWPHFLPGHPCSDTCQFAHDTYAHECKISCKIHCQNTTERNIQTFRGLDGNPHVTPINTSQTRQLALHWPRHCMSTNRNQEHQTPHAAYTNQHQLHGGPNTQGCINALAKQQMPRTGTAPLEVEGCL